MTKLPRTRQASYEQGWEEGYARGEDSALQDLKHHIANLVDELNMQWVPDHVTASLQYLKKVINE